jgi:hypothetical protein
LEWICINIVAIMVGIIGSQAPIRIEDKSGRSPVNGARRSIGNLFRGSCIE